MGIRLRALRDAHREARVRWRRRVGHVRQRPQKPTGLDCAAERHARSDPASPASQSGERPEAPSLRYGRRTPRDRRGAGTRRSRRLAGDSAWRHDPRSTGAAVGDCRHADGRAHLGNRAVESVARRATPCVAAAERRSWRWCISWRITRGHAAIGHFARRQHARVRRRAGSRRRTLSETVRSTTGPAAGHGTGQRPVLFA